MSKKAFASYLTGRTDKYVKAGARNTITLNADQDDAKVRYARVPDGQACDFCRMLGSRGFVYHSDIKAGGGFNSYHPFCNCQIAVAFDAYQTKYVKGTVTVTRGFSNNAQLAAKGADGTSSLRAYDPDELFEMYQEMGKKFSPTQSKIFTGSAGLADQTQSPFQSFGDMENYLSQSVDIDDLKDRCEVVEKWWNRRIYSDKYFNRLQSYVKLLRSQLPE